jgi:uncharacterized protein (TIGR03546 family)
MMTRKIGKLLRGKATPMQLMLACVLGSLMGFMPGFTQAAGVLVVLTILLIVLNANLFLAAMTGLLAKAVALAVMPATFLVGRLLLDGPLSGLFQWMINAPVLALFGFDYYLTTGGLVMGAIFGVIIGVLVIRAITAFRKKMATVQEGSERYQKWANTWYVKLITFVFIGGGGKKDYAQLLTKKMGNPFRTIGVIAAVLFLALIWIAGQFFNEPIVTAAVRGGLERANGATVDIDRADLSFRESRLTLEGFAMADPNDLGTDLLRASTVTAAISGRDLLRKRLALDEVVLIDASSGEERRIPGRIVGRRPQPAPDDPTIRLPEEKTIEEYIEQAEVWKERLAQARRWLERLSGPEEAVEPDPEKRKETLRDRLDQQIREAGYAWVRANHLIAETPTFIVYKLDAERVQAKQLEDETVNIRGRNVSTHPHLNKEPASIRIESSGDRLFALLSLDHVIDAAKQSELRFHLKGIDTDTIAKHLKLGGETVLKGGTTDVVTSGIYGEEGPGWVDLPLNVTLHNATLSIAGREELIDQFVLPIRVRGPIDQPLITVDDDQLAQALIDAGAGRLVRELEGRLKLDERIGDQLDRIGIPGLGGSREQNGDAGNDKDPADRIGDAIREGAGGLLRRGGDR